MKRTIVRGVLVGAIAALSACAVGVGPLAASSPRSAGLPQTAAARQAASWLAHQVTGAGDIVSAHEPDLSDTAQAVLALAAEGHEHAAALRGLHYLEHHVNAYVKDDGSDGPGQLATLILDAKALGANPRSFDGTNLVTRLLATLQTSGVNAGLFGAQAPTYDGAYRQGLALAALAAAGDRKTSRIAPAIAWLQGQQCANGAWEAYRASTAIPCTPSDPTTYSGPDTNSTSLAIQGLVAQGASIPTSPKAFFESLQQHSGGFGYYGGPADPDSTALVIQALIALHLSVSSAAFTKGTRDAVTALLGFKLHDGAFYYPGSKSPNLLATEQALPALEKDAFPF